MGKLCGFTFLRKRLNLLGGSEMPAVVIPVRNCPIESVVVFLDRAEVRRVVPVGLGPGENLILITDLAECIDKNSIRCIKIDSGFCWRF